MANWYYYINDVRLGPVSESDLQILAAKGAITPDTIVSNEEGQGTYARNVQGLSFPGQATAPPVRMTSSLSLTGKQGQTMSRWEVYTTIPWIALTNAPALLFNILCVVIVAWVPLVNIGAFIGLLAICCKLTRPGSLRCTEVLDARYRNTIGNFVVQLSMMSGGALAVAIGFILPLFFLLPLGVFLIAFPLEWLPPDVARLVSDAVFAILSVGPVIITLVVTGISGLVAFLAVFIGWVLAPLLLCDKGMGPAEAMQVSTARMNGYKSPFLGLLLFYPVMSIVLAGIAIGLVAIDWDLSLLNFYFGLGLFLIAAGGALIALNLIIPLAIIGFFYDQRTADIKPKCADTSPPTPRNIP